MDRRVQPLFLISLPRSGSTLLQRMLASHSQVATTSEPWVLLPLLYSRRREGVYAEYGHRLAATAIDELCGRLGGGLDDFHAAVREFAVRLYTAASGADHRIFLDKTPRYMLVASELLEVFPDGRFICLWRNPLAVLGSLTESWGNGRWQPWLHKVDLYDGLEAMIEAYTRKPERFTSVRYEDLVENPKAVCERLLKDHALPWEPQVVEGFTDTRLDGSVGDKTGTARYDRVSNESLHRWKRSLASPVRKTWCRRYLHWVGRERLEAMGYRLDELLAELDGIDNRWSLAVPDAVRTVKGVAYNAVEPQIVKRKASRLPSWRRVSNHT